jgi:hypothetical protein
MNHHIDAFLIIQLSTNHGLLVLVQATAFNIQTNAFLCALSSFFFLGDIGSSFASFVTTSESSHRSVTLLTSDTISVATSLVS